MRRELLSVLAMGAILAGSQLIAIAISPLFQASELRAFPEPENPVNTVIYILLILAFTAVILGFIRARRRNFAKYVILGAIFLTLSFVLLLPVYYSLVPLPEDEFRGNLATIIAFVLAGGLVWALVKHPEWYVVDGVGIITAAGVMAIMGISFAIFPAILLLVGLAIYDAWAVYRTKHMVALADELTTQRLPILLVIPKRAGYSLRQQKSLREQVASGEEREAMFIGLGDLIIPGVLSVSAFNFSEETGTVVAGLAPNAAVALATVLGSLAGFGLLMRFVLRGNPQAGLPLLNGGAILGFLLAHFLIYGSVGIGFP